MTSEHTFSNNFLFSRFFQIENSDERTSVESIISSLTHPFSENDEGLSRKCEKIQLDEIISENQEVSEYLESFGSQFSAWRYWYEVRSKRVYLSPESGDINEKTVKEARTADIFWDGEEHIYVKGSIDSGEEVESVLRKEMNELRLREVVLDSAFLNWLFYKCRENQPLRREFSLQRITDIELINQGQLRGAAGEDYRGMEVENKLRPMADVLQGADITRLVGEFEVAGYSVDANITSRGDIRVLSGAGSLADSENLRRLLIVLRFVHEIISYYSEWSQENSHPPAHFYYNLYKDIEDEGFSVNLSAEELRMPSNGILSKQDELIAETEADIIDAEIDEILQQGESETIEFKRDLPGHYEKIAKEVVALANKRGGVLVIGVDDEGEIIGLDDYKSKEETVSNIIDGSVQPPLNASIQFEYIEEKPLLVIRVGQFRSLPHAVNYTFYTRLGTTKRKLSPFELNRLMTKEQD